MKDFASDRRRLARGLSHESRVLLALWLAPAPASHMQSKSPLPAPHTGRSRGQHRKALSITPRERSRALREARQKGSSPSLENLGTPSDNCNDRPWRKARQQGLKPAWSPAACPSSLSCPLLVASSLNFCWASSVRVGMQPPAAGLLSYVPKKTRTQMTACSCELVGWAPLSCTPNFGTCWPNFGTCCQSTTSSQGPGRVGHTAGQLE